MPEGKSAENRVHIDIRVAGEGRWDMPGRERLIRAKVPELVARGGTVLSGKNTTRTSSTTSSYWTQKATSSAWHERPSMTELIPKK